MPGSLWMLSSWQASRSRAVHRREVSLDDLDSRLRGAVAIAAEHTLVGASGTRAAVLGALPQPSVTTDEVHAFVRTLLATGNIQIGRERAWRGGSRCTHWPANSCCTRPWQSQSAHACALRVLLKEMRHGVASLELAAMTHMMLSLGHTSHRRKALPL